MSGSSVSVASKNTITLKGSAQIVAEFFGYSINSILYQRGLYDPNLFTRVNKYGLPLQVTTDLQLQAYLKNVLEQLTAWLTEGQVKKLVLVITGIDTETVLERWIFNVETDKQTLNANGTSNKPESEIMKEISAILRQITSSVSFLPLLDQPCTFDLLVYTPADCSIPSKWEESDPKYITNSNEVRLRSFTTKIHKVETSVSYRADDD